ncbi:hypothetical protein VTK56DRAFT_2029 [Thermocarpiscus australiensis]
MAQKSQISNQSNDQPNSDSRTSSAKDGPPMSDPTPISASNSESPRPMEKPSGTGSQPSPYGTRSRNRTAATRPNYAEDKELDLDLFDVYPQRKDDDSKKASTKQQGGASSSNAAQAAPRSANGTVTQNGAKDQRQSQNQSSAASASSAAGGSTTTSGPAKSKKRKAASAADAASTASRSQTPSGSNGNSNASALQKRLGPSGQGSENATPSGPGYSETNMLTFENTKARLQDGKLVADDGKVLEVNDHVYLVCEPPGEPYYLGRIMEFLHVKNDPTMPIDALRINWYYRPKDIGRKVQDTRLVFATMHSDISPLTSLRGKCQIRHKAEIEDMAAYKRSPDCFWYEKLYDRYIQKNYEVIPTSQVINVPEHVKKVLDERWKFVLTEQGRGKELTSAVKTCKRCSTFCANNDSVDCAVCQNTYHMNCVRPPLLKKPSRGFAWSCAACSRAQERKLEARNTPNIVEGNPPADADADADDDEGFDDEDEELGAVDGVDTGRTSRTSPVDEGAHPPPTAEQIYHASLWPYRYLGMHCKVEDALDLDDRIFPRASTRLGLRHQAIVPPWYGRPVRYVKPLEFKKSGKNGKLTKEQQAALEAERIKREKRPKWIQDEPPGYVERGGDDTSTLLYKPPEDCGVSMSSEALDEYMNTARSMAGSLGLPPRSTNLQDVARDVLFRNGFDPERALQELAKLPKSEFKEPELTPAEQKRFEEGVAKYGSELHSVKKHVKTLEAATVTRWYYTWKKTERGRQIWGNFSGRKGKKDAKKAEAAASKLADDVADDHDDSAFDAEKAKEKKKSFICKFCGTKKSRQWRRAPAAAVTPITENGGRNSNNKDKKDQYIQALCRRCAELWRRYAIQWEDVEEVAKKVAQTGGKGWRRRVDEELYKELVAADEMMNNTRFPTPDPVVTASPADSSSTQAAGSEPPRKKLKVLADKDAEHPPSDTGSVSGGPASKKKKEKAADKQLSQQPPPPAPVPEIPKPRTLPCAICREMEPLGDQHLSCRECRLTVHRNCYGVVDSRPSSKWTCDMCVNDKSPQLSIHYKCVLCPVDYTEHDFVGPLKISTSHKKKTEKERERERMERENAQKAAEYYRKKQEEMNRPVNPREPLKRTADNNWVHVTCAVWTPEVKFGNAKALSPSEGIPLIPRARYAEVCKVCKKDDGACVHCHQCHTAVHVECAHQAGYVLGFDVTPVKGSRRDQFRIVTINGESGVMSAAVWCKEHAPTKTIVHRMHDLVAENGLNALQLYVQNYKQADLTLTGCARKANQLTVASKMSTSPSHQNRRASVVTWASGEHRDAVPSALQPGGKICLTCGVDVSPKWYPIDQDQERVLTNGYFGNLGSEAQKFVEQRSFQCHKCKKAGRQSNPHPLPPKEAEPTPPPEPARQASQAAAAILPPVGPAEPRHPTRGPYGWSPQLHPAPGPPLPVHPTPLQAPPQSPMALPTVPPAVQAPPVAPPPLPPTIAPRAAPVQPHSSGLVLEHPHSATTTAGPLRPVPLGLLHDTAIAPPMPSSRPFDWRRPSSGHGPPPLHPSRDIKGAPSPPPTSIPPLAPPNHLRPPPITSIPHPSAPSQRSSHIVQPPFVNGMPESPRRSSVAAPPNSASYPSHHGHGPPDIRSHHMVRNEILVPGMAAPEAPQPLNYLRQRSHHGPVHHGSPPALRESAPVPREPSLPPPRENRPATGASASPSLRNLLI